MTSLDEAYGWIAVIGGELAGQPNQGMSLTRAQEEVALNRKYWPGEAETPNEYFVVPLRKTTVSDPQRRNGE